jgi:hypothetical protein
MNIELEEINVNERTIEVSGFIYQTIEAYNDGIFVTFEWELDIIREYNIDEWCEGWNVEFDERKMLINSVHLFDILTKQDYNKVVDEIDYHLANN